MIGFLHGTVAGISDRHIIIDVSGVGYRVTIGEKAKKSISKIGQKVNVFTHFILNPREGYVELYGFETAEELDFFELLTTVSGVGPKSAQAILSNVDLQTLQNAIVQGDDSYLKKVSGVGEKTAKRLILELRSKIAAIDTGHGRSPDFTAQEEAVDALVALGYSPHLAREAIRQVSDTATTTEAKITEALRIMGRKK